MILIELIKTIAYEKKILSNQVHLRSCLDWLHNNFNKGYFLSYSPLRKEGKPSSRNSGDVLSSIIAYHKTYDSLEFHSDIVSCTNWLLEIQNEDGSYFDSGKKQQHFDTGVVLLGLTDAYYYFNKRKDIKDAIVKAADWLVRTEYKEGISFEVTHDIAQYKYYSKISWALLKVWKLTDDPIYKEVAIRNLNWIINQQNSDGYLQQIIFSKSEDRCICAITFVLDGLLESYKILKDDKYLKPVLVKIDQIYGISQRKFLIPISQYDENWMSKNTYKCICGLIQLARIYVTLYEINNNLGYLEEAKKLLTYIKSKQFLDKTFQKLYGAFPTMSPVWRGHGRFEFLSINNKLFIELILRLDKYQKGQDDLESYVAKTFDFFSDDEYVSTKIGKRDKRILDISKEYIGKKVLDVGCGKGKYVKYLRNMQIDAYGIDPSVEYVKKANEKFVCQGSIYDIRYEDGKFDSVLLIEVLQHVANFVKAFQEIKKVLRKNGHFIVLERNKISISQILKPFREQLNLWMYPSDSPFKEISLYKSEWIKEFSKYGRIKLIQKISGDGIKAKYIDKYYLFIVEIKK